MRALWSKWHINKIACKSIQNIFKEQIKELNIGIKGWYMNCVMEFET